MLFNFADDEDAQASSASAAELMEAREVALDEEVDASGWPVEAVWPCSCAAGHPAARHAATRGAPAERCAVCGLAELRKPIVPESRVPELLADAPGLSAAVRASDLVPGGYEGGFKLWECAVDLLHELGARHRDGTLRASGASVLEAGCGAGLPSLLALQLGCRVAVLHDFNAEVLQSLTMPSLRLNGLAHAPARFYAGDWAHLDSLLTSQRRAEAAAVVEAAAPSSSPPLPPDGFDLILTSDTIYDAGAARRLWHLIASQLRRPVGLALVAAKSYYFGVGGSVAAFRTLVEEDGRFSCTSARVVEDGASNRREVLLIRWRTHVE